MNVYSCCCCCCCCCCCLPRIFPHSAHMWFDVKVHDANTNEDPHHPEITKRVSVPPHIRTHAHTHTPTHAHVRTHARTHARTHTHTHTTHTGRTTSGCTSYCSLPAYRKLEYIMMTSNYIHMYVPCTVHTNA